MQMDTVKSIKPHLWHTGAADGGAGASNQGAPSGRKKRKWNEPAVLACCRKEKTTGPRLTSVAQPPDKGKRREASVGRSLNGDRARGQGVMLSEGSQREGQEERVASKERRGKLGCRRAIN